MSDHCLARVSVLPVPEESSQAGGDGGNRRYDSVVAKRKFKNLSKAIIERIILLVIFFSLLSGCSHKEEIVKTYYRTGSVKSETIVIDGYRNGTSREYFANGRLRRMDEYKNDSLNGISRRYYPSGQLAEDLLYLKGRLVGENRFYSKEGLVKEFRKYDSLGRLIDLASFNQFGDLSFVQPIPIAYTNKELFKAGESGIFFARVASADPSAYREGILIITSCFDQLNKPLDTLSIIRSSNIEGFQYSFVAKEPCQIFGQLIFEIPTDSARIEVVYSLQYNYVINK